MCWRSRLFILLYLMLLTIPVLQFCGVLFIMFTQKMGYSKEIHSEEKQNSFEEWQKNSQQSNYTIKEGIDSYPPYKIYIHEMPERFNEDLVNCLVYNHSMQVRNGWMKYQGFGPQTSSDHVMSIRDTWQFSLELIIHNKLKNSLYRTWNQTDAKVFYLPFYSGLSCFCYSQDLIGGHNINKDFFTYIRTLESLKEGKAHLMALGMIEREHSMSQCGLLRFNLTKYITFIGIEQEADEGLRKKTISTSRPLIVAPYPSFGHLLPGATTQDIENLHNHNRSIFILFAGASRKSGWEQIRNKVTGKFLTRISTYLKYDDYKNENRMEPNFMKGVYLSTSEFQDNTHIMSWMKNSVFCLQPAGDTPTRKSFYDSVTAGCIPVIFKYKEKVKYPFEERIDYNKLAVIISTDDVKDLDSIHEILSQMDHRTIGEKQKYMHEVTRYLQYSYPIEENCMHTDAVQYILYEMEQSI